MYSFSRGVLLSLSLGISLVVSSFLIINYINNVKTQHSHILLSLSVFLLGLIMVTFPSHQFIEYGYFIFTVSNIFLILYLKQFWRKIMGTIGSMVGIVLLFISFGLIFFKINHDCWSAYLFVVSSFVLYYLSIGFKSRGIKTLIGFGGLMLMVSTIGLPYSLEKHISILWSMLVILSYGCLFFGITIDAKKFFDLN